MADDKTKSDDKTKPEDMVPQADKQAHTEIAEREGKQGEQARVINKEEAEKRKDR
jgi:fructose-1,6-bisphosphatase/inositol monophosphatase family enzyme